MGSHSSRGNREHRRHLHGTPGLAGDLGLRFSGDGPRPGLSESHSPDRDRDESSPAVQCGSECPGDLRARRKLRENGDDSRPFFLRSYSRDVFSFVPFSVDVDVGVSLSLVLATISKFSAPEHSHEKVLDELTWIKLATTETLSLSVE